MNVSSAIRFFGKLAAMALLGQRLSAVDATRLLVFVNDADFLGCTAKRIINRFVLRPYFRLERNSFFFLAISILAFGIGTALVLHFVDSLRLAFSTLREQDSSTATLTSVMRFVARSVLLASLILSPGLSGFWVAPLILLLWDWRI